MGRDAVALPRHEQNSRAADFLARMQARDASFPCRREAAWGRSAARSSDAAHWPVQPMRHDQRPRRRIFEVEEGKRAVFDGRPPMGAIEMVLPASSGVSTAGTNAHCRCRR